MTKIIDELALQVTADVVDLSQFTLKENSTLVIEIENTLKPEQKKNIIDQLKCIFDENTKILVLDNGMKLKVIHDEQ